MPELHAWGDITAGFKYTLVLGNGASMAVHRGFGYECRDRPRRWDLGTRVK